MSPRLPPADQAWVLNETAFDLRALGRLTEAMEPMRAGPRASPRSRLASCLTGLESGKILAVPRQTMDWQRMGRLVVTVHTAAIPNDREWADYMAGVDAYLPLSGQRILVVSAGGGPNGTQRKMMTDALGGATVPVAIITSSMMMRGASIAVSWFNPSLKVFGPDGLKSAIDYLELTPWERSESMRVVKELETQLGLAVVRPLPAS